MSSTTPRGASPRGPPRVVHQTTAISASPTRAEPPRSTSEASSPPKGGGSSSPRHGGQHKTSAGSPKASPRRYSSNVGTAHKSAASVVAAAHAAAHAPAPAPAPVPAAEAAAPAPATTGSVGGAGSTVSPTHSGLGKIPGAVSKTSSKTSSVGESPVTSRSGSIKKADSMRGSPRGGGGGGGGLIRAASGGGLTKGAGSFRKQKAEIADHHNAAKASPVPQGKLRICVAGHSEGNKTTARAHHLAALMAEKLPEHFETWYYFDEPPYYNAFIREMGFGNTVTLPAGITTHTPFVWTEKLTPTNVLNRTPVNHGPNLMTVVGGDGVFAEQVQRNSRFHNNVKEIEDAARAPEDSEPDDHVFTLPGQTAAEAAEGDDDEDTDDGGAGLARVGSMRRGSADFSQRTQASGVYTVTDAGSVLEGAVKPGRNRARPLAFDRPAVPVLIGVSDKPTALPATGAGDWGGSSGSDHHGKRSGSPLKSGSGTGGGAGGGGLTRTGSFSAFQKQQAAAGNDNVVIARMHHADTASRLSPVGYKKTRLCVAGLLEGQCSAEAHRITSLMAEKLPQSFETWYYFDEPGCYYAFLKNEFHNVPLPATLTDPVNSTAAPFFWLEKLARDDEKKQSPMNVGEHNIIINVLGGGSRIFQYLQEYEGLYNYDQEILHMALNPETGLGETEEEIGMMKENHAVMLPEQTVPKTKVTEEEEEEAS